MSHDYPQSFDQSRLCELIPHREPLLLIDSVHSWGPEFLIGHKKVTGQEPVFQGHFPSEAIYPGVYLIEGLAQAAAALLYLIQEETWENGIYYLASLADVKFRKSVHPGDTIEYRINFKKKHGRFVQVDASATVQDKEVCSAIITSAQGRNV